MEEHNKENQPEEKKTNEKSFGNFHDRNYKKILIIPAILLVLSLLSLANFYSNTGEFFNRDISLTGGTSITLYEDTDIENLRIILPNELEDVQIREIYDVVTREQVAVIIETKSDGDITRTVLESYLGYSLSEENSSFEFTGSSLSESFFRQLITAILFAFIFMAIVVFVIFRNLIPSLAVILAAFADIVMTLALVNFLGMDMSSAGIVALLMLIGYSVDTDILLTTRILKRREGTLNERMFGAFKTGITMTLTSLLAILFALFFVRSFSVVLTQIFTILSIGLVFDILNTWTTNASILKWYVENKSKK